MSTILLVEDNPITRRMRRLALESEGYGVVEAGDGRGALEAATVSPPELLVLDHVLPDTDGLQLLEEIRRRAGAPELPRDIARPHGAAAWGRSAAAERNEDESRSGRALDAVIMMDEQGLVVSWNARAEQLFGWTSDEAIGRTVSELIIPHRLREAMRGG